MDNTAAGSNVRVVFIGGAPRSGSTLLGLLVGQVPGFTSVGELKYVWERGLRENQLCGCGRPFLDCEYWGKIGETAFGGWDALDAREMLALEAEVDAHRRLPLLLAPKLSRGYESTLRAYADVLGRIYRAAQAVSGASVVVDTTKRPAYAFLLRHVPGIELGLVHLVRDSRGVAFSWGKRVVKPEVVDRVAYMPSYGALESSARWAAGNLLFEILERRVPSVRVKYESLVASPHDELSRLLRELGEERDDSALSFVRAGEVDLAENHTLAGNPMRFKRGPLQLRLDQQWQTAMDRRRRLVVSLLTFPLLARYGYAGGRNGSAR